MRGDDGLTTAAGEAWRAAIEAAAALIDCGCGEERKAAVAGAGPGENGAARWRACGENNCMHADACAIRALRPPRGLGGA